ncbi:MAG: hypothetical protein GX112_12420 [Clostridiaceae bacterium]|jgi:DNA repair exonuclease SbcCD ATPase subunit|nr:hypothetical protein [Clostridiaceae bacterium]
MIDKIPDSESLMAWKADKDRLPILQRRASQLRQKLQEADRNVMDQEAVLAGEQADVDRLEGKSLGNYILSLSRKLDARRQKEEAELVAACHRLDELREEQRYLRQALLEQQQQIMAAGQAERAWNQALADLKSGIRAETAHALADPYREREAALSQVNSQVGEIEQARTVARRAQATADTMLERLRSAEGWSSYDVWFKGGIVTHVAKYNHLDAASDLMSHLSAQLRDLRSELADIRMDLGDALNTYTSGTRALDYFFDNIFTDLSVRDRVREDLDTVQRIKGKLHQVERELDLKLSQAKGQAGQLQHQLQEILLQYAGATGD